MPPNPFPALQLPEIPWAVPTSAPNPRDHFASRLLLALGLGFGLFLPEVERTFLGLTRMALGKRAARADVRCGQCGHLNRGTVLFCVRCGSELSRRGQAPVGRTSFWTGAVGRGVLALAGIYYLYLGLVSQTIYDWITGPSPSDVLLVTIGTFLSALVPTFFTLASLRQSLFLGAHAITRYEKAMRSPGFWYLGGVLAIAVGLWPAGLQGNLEDPFLLVAIIVGLGLVFYGRSVRRPRPVTWTSTW
jgi:hypothetical protein